MCSDLILFFNLKMERLQSFVAVCLLSFSIASIQIYCEERYMTYSKRVTPGVANSSLALFDKQGVSLIHCGCLCLEQHCCKEFMYSKSNQRCIGVQFNDFNSTGNTNLILSGNEEMSTYQKGCEAGWLEFNGHCYYLGQNKVTWSQAKTECQSMCSYLTEIENNEEAQWISDTFLNKAGCGADIFFDCTAWIGLNDLDVEGTYIWDHSKAPLTFSSWHVQEPSKLNPAEALTKDCIDMLRGGVWNDRPCSYLNNLVICEKSFGQ